MKLSTKLKISFCVLIILPAVMFLVAFVGIMSVKLGQIKRSYNASVSSYESLANPIDLVSQMCKTEYDKLVNAANHSPEQLSNNYYLDGINTRLKRCDAFIIIANHKGCQYSGDPDGERVLNALSEIDFGDNREAGIYLGDGFGMVINRIRFTQQGSGPTDVFVVMRVSGMINQTKRLLIDGIFAIILILVLTSGVFTTWMYKETVSPINKLKLATYNIKNGNLDFDMDVSGKDEIAELCQDFDAMRARLKENAEEKVRLDAENRELISNISHDLKTPITAIKGYVEGIMDGVVDTPEKMEKYIRTIYNKACDMDKLVDELTFYSKIDTDKIPYNFINLSAREYFEDCIEEIKAELESQSIVFASEINLEYEVEIQIDPEQMKRVINNIISNSVKYMDKPHREIGLHVTADESCVYVDLSDNGAGISAEALPHIFDRFYRSDSSRNSRRGGSGIGLSIVRKLVEDHNGLVTAESEEGVGTTMHIVLNRHFKEEKTRTEADE